MGMIFPATNFEERREKIDQKKTQLGVEEMRYLIERLSKLTTDHGDLLQYILIEFSSLVDAVACLRNAFEVRIQRAGYPEFQQNQHMTSTRVTTTPPPRSEGKEDTSMSEGDQKPREQSGQQSEPLEPSVIDYKEISKVQTTGSRRTPHNMHPGNETPDQAKFEEHELPIGGQASIIQNFRSSTAQIAPVPDARDELESEEQQIIQDVKAIKQLEDSLKTKEADYQEQVKEQMKEHNTASSGPQLRYGAISIIGLAIGSTLAFWKHLGSR